MACDICPIIEQPSEEEAALRLVEGGFWRATLRGKDQSLLGTTFITNKRHVESLGELTEQEWLEFAGINRDLETAFKHAFGAQVINTSCLMNLAFKPGEDPRPHVHWHLKPRYANPVMIDGIEEPFTDPMFGKYLTGDHVRRPLEIKEALSVANMMRLHMPLGSKWTIPATRT